MTIRQGLLAVGEQEERLPAEAALLQAAATGDRAALERLLAPHQLPLLSFCYGILGHTQDAEDAAQETFLQALRALTRFRGEATFRTWLFRIAVRVCLRRKVSRRPTEPLDEQRAPGDVLPSPEAIALDRLRVFEALRSLPARHLALLLLKEREGWSVTEIAQAMGWSPIRVKNELAKARRALLELRQQSAGDGEAR